MAYGNANKTILEIGTDIDRGRLARILLSAERYARGQPASIGEFVANQTGKYADVLTREQLKDIIDDIDENTAGKSDGWNIDENAWASLASQLKFKYELGGESDAIIPASTAPMAIHEDDWQMLSCGTALRYDMGVTKAERNVSIGEYVKILKNLPPYLASAAKVTIASDIVMSDQWMAFDGGNVPSDLYPLRALVGLPDSTVAPMNAPIPTASMAAIGA